MDANNAHTHDHDHDRSTGGTQRRRQARTRGFWTKEATLAAAREYAAENGTEALSADRLSKAGRHDLAQAIRENGGWRAWLWPALRVRPLRTPPATLTPDQLLAAARDHAERHGLRRIVRSDLGAIAGELGISKEALRSRVKRLGGISRLNERLGLEVGRQAKPGTWTRSAVLSTLQQLLATHGSGAIRESWLLANGHGGLLYAARRHGGLVAFQRELGLQPAFSGPLPLRAEALAADLRKLVEALGAHVASLPAKSWLAILRQSEGLKAISPRSVLYPVKLQLLEGRITPADLLPPPSAPAESSEPAEPQPSRLQQLLAEVVAAAGGDAIEEAEEEPAQPGRPAEVPLDPQEDPQERRARLLTLRPEQRLEAVSAAARATSDEATLRSIALTQVEQLWMQLYAATAAEAEALVEEIRAAVPADAWAALVRDSFLADYRLIEESGEISGLKLPDGFALNLMQRRESALLLRDRRRLNLSGMGGGKTLSAIAAAQLAGLNRVLVIAPNSAISTWLQQLGTFLPTASVASKTWSPCWEPEDRPRWLIVNHEMLADRNSEEIALFLHEEQPELVVVDELHQCKMRDRRSESQRHQNLVAMAQRVREQDGFLYGMTGTPVVNDLSEAVDLLALVNPQLAEGLDTRLTIDACLAIHETLQPVSTRYLPPAPAVVNEQTIEVRADHLLDEVLAAGQRSLGALDSALAIAKIPALVELAARPGKLVVFTSAVAGVIAPTQRALAEAGIRSVVFTGEQKRDEDGRCSLDAFLRDPKVRVLIASTACLSAGYDGLQRIAGRIAFLSLPWTAAELEQAVARIVRQGVAFAEVEVTTLCAVLGDPETGEDWSLDRQKLERLTTKRSVAAAVADGVIPEAAALRWSQATVRRAVRAWARRLQQQRAQRPEVA